MEMLTSPAANRLSAGWRLLLFAAALPVAGLSAVSVFLGLVVTCDEGHCPADWILTASFLLAWVAALSYATAAIALLIGSITGNRPRIALTVWPVVGALVCVVVYFYLVTTAWPD